MPNSGGHDLATNRGCLMDSEVNKASLTNSKSNFDTFTRLHVRISVRVILSPRL